MTPRVGPFPGRFRVPPAPCRTAMLFLYNLLFPLLFLVYLPFYLVHIIRRGGLTRDFWERFGIFPAAAKARLRALKAPVWVHAVSVGETVAALSFIDAWLKRHPDTEMVFSCGTSTGFATARQKLPPQVVPIYCPIDLWWMVWRTLRLVRPRLLAIFEVEIWPNLILQAKRRGAKVVLVNGRLSDKSSAGYAKWGCFFRRIFNAFDALCLQTPEDVARIERVIGPSPRIHAVGTVKFDQIPDRNSVDVQAKLDAAFGTAPRTVLCAGSTHGGEEEPVCRAVKALRADHPELRLVLVPRHAERAPEVVKVVEACGLSWQSAQPVQGATPSASPCEVLLVNTTGQLMNYYSGCDICFVGKSLAGQTGGHNIIEPAIFGKAVLYGEHLENFRQVAAIFAEEHAGLLIPDGTDFAAPLRSLLESPQKRAELGANARRTVEKHRGAIARTLDTIDRL